LIREHTTSVDIICDFCTSKLSDFIDDPKQFPHSIHQAHKIAAQFHWQFTGGWELCPTCR